MKNPLEAPKLLGYGIPEAVPAPPKRFVGQSENGRDGGLVRAIRHAWREIPSQQ
jgi:hypothetical protein